MKAEPFMPRLTLPANPRLTPEPEGRQTTRMVDFEASDRKVFDASTA